MLAQRAASEGWEGSSQTILLTRRGRTIGMCSLDARSEGQSGCFPESEVGKTRKPSPGQMARFGVPVGGRVRTLRAVGIIPATPYSDSSLRPCLGQGASLGEEAVLGDSGRAGAITARVGWVRSLVFLSILWGIVGPQPAKRKVVYEPSGRRCFCA